MCDRKLLYTNNNGVKQLCQFVVKPAMLFAEDLHGLAVYQSPLVGISHSAASVYELQSYGQIISDRYGKQRWVNTHTGVESNTYSRRTVTNIVHHMLICTLAIFKTRMILGNILIVALLRGSVQ